MSKCYQTVAPALTCHGHARVWAGLLSLYIDSSLHARGHRIQWVTSIGWDASSHITFSLSLCLRAWWSCVKVQHQMAGWEQLRTNEEEHHPATCPLEFRHLQKSKYSFSQMGNIHEQRRWIEKVSSKLPCVWNRLCGWCPSYGWGHRGSCPKSQSYQVIFFYCFVFCHCVQTLSLTDHTVCSVGIWHFYGPV